MTDTEDKLADAKSQAAAPLARGDMTNRVDPWIREQLRQIVKAIGMQRTIETAREIDRELTKRQDDVSSD